jgi:hypothetical protein
MCKWPIHLFTNPNPVYSHTYYVTVLGGNFERTAQSRCLCRAICVTSAPVHQSLRMNQEHSELLFTFIPIEAVNLCVHASPTELSVCQAGLIAIRKLHSCPPRRHNCDIVAWNPHMRIFTYSMRQNIQYWNEKTSCCILGCVSIDGVWIGEWIYRTLVYTTRN